MAEWLVSIVGLVEASPSTLKLWQSVRLASKGRTPRFLWFASFLASWNPVAAGLPFVKPAAVFSRRRFLCTLWQAGGRASTPRPGPARLVSLCFLPPGLVAGGRAGVYLARGAGGATGGG